jgi:hypothetical protein
MRNFIRKCCMDTEIQDAVARIGEHLVGEKIGK